MVFFVVVFTLFKCSHTTGCYYNEERGTGEPLGGTPSSNGVYRAGTFSGFRFMEGQGIYELKFMKG